MIMHRGRNAWVAILFLIANCWSLEHTSPRARGQTETPVQSADDRLGPTSILGTGPYRRIFFPSSELPSMALEDYRPIEVERLVTLLEERARRQALLDPNAPDLDPELRAFHAQVKLMGADLVADRSRLQWSLPKDSTRWRTAKRRTLSPWSPAIDPQTISSVEPGLSSVTTPAAWMYDSTGTPSLRVTNTEDWFSWTLHPQPSSTPNRLNYALSFPRTVDSCIVLQLPKSARIVDANVVVRPVTAWTEVQSRLKSWPIGPTATEVVPDWNATDAFWLLELSGQDQARFSILLGSNRSLQDPPTENETQLQPFSRLVAKQSVTHAVANSLIRTECQWEWTESTTTERSIRIRIPEGFRLRSVWMNDRESNLRFLQRVVEIALPTSEETLPPLAPSQRIKMRAEFLASPDELPKDERGRIVLPAIECLQSYVMSGTTTIVPSSDLELRDVSASHGRLEGIRKTSDDSQRLDYSWFQSAPQISFQVSPRPFIDRAEAITRLSTDAHSVTAIVRMQWTPWHDRAAREIRVPAPWRVDATQISHKGLEVSQQASTPGAPTVFRIEPLGTVDNTPIQIELQLSRAMPDAVTLSLGSEPWIELPGRSLRESVVIEPGYAGKLEYIGDYHQEVADEESLSNWQRERLPRLGKYLIFATGTGRLPSLAWRSESSQLQVNVSTWIHDESESVRMEHRWDVATPMSSAPSLSIQLSGSWRWEYETPKGWKTISPTSLQDSGANENTWQLNLANLSDSERATSKGFALRATRRASWHEGSAELDIPVMKDVSSVRYEVHTDASLQLEASDVPSRWSFDSQGEPVLKWQATDPSGQVQKLRLRRAGQGWEKKSWMSRSELHVAVDAQGNQRAILRTDVQRAQAGPWKATLNLPEGWTVDGVVDRNEGDRVADRSHQDGTSGTYTWHTDSDATVVSWHANARRASKQALRMSVALSGPKLAVANTRAFGVLPRLGYTFVWPDIRWEPDATLVRRHAWIPADFAVDTMPESWQEATSWATSQPPKVESLWSPWAWYRESLSWFGINGAAHRELPTDGLPREFLPEWMTVAWKEVPMFDGSGSPLRPSVRIVAHSGGSLPGLLVLCAAIMTWTGMARAPWSCLIAAFVCALVGHWINDAIALWFRALFVGMGLGSALFLLKQASEAIDLRPKDRLPKSDRWMPWNEPNLIGDSPGDASGRTRAATAVCLAIVASIGMQAYGQDLLSMGKTVESGIIDIYVPLDEDGTIAENRVYVPDELLNATDTPAFQPTQESQESFLINAKHLLRFDGRSIGFGNTEQPCIHTYEVWISEASVGRPWRIPLPTDRSRLSRFSVDGVEVPSSRVTRNDTELQWYPERPGRRTLQLETQLRIRPLDRDRGNAVLLNDLRPPRGWAIDTSILPAGNALLEVETDGAWSVDFSARGRVSNPSIGKFSIQLGGVDRLVGELVPTPAPGTRTTPATIPEGTGSSANDASVMNTELFIDRDQLLARTIIEFPRAVESATEIEIEADALWRPIGNLWGDAQLVDIRAGSTLDRRRYVLRWIASGITTGKRTIATSWIPAGETSLRSILFAECRDRRVRPGTLRYARSAGSTWQLEGINTWIPSINTKERLEWTELSERPIATSLKIPLSGGFGVLRQQLEQKPPRARVTHQWTIGAAKSMLKSRIECSPALSNRHPFVAALPVGYVPVSVTAKMANLPFLAWQDTDRIWIQVLLDRDSGEVNELMVTSEQAIPQGPTGEWSTPWVELRGIETQDQFIELFADPTWRIDPWDAGNRALRGFGTIKSLGSLSATAPGASRIRGERMNASWKGTIQANLLGTSATDTEWELVIDQPEAAALRPVLTLSIPSDMAKKWQSSEANKELPSLDPSRKIIQVSPKWTDDLTRASMRMVLNTEPQVQWSEELITTIQVVSDPELVCISTKPLLHKDPDAQPRPTSERTPSERTPSDRTPSDRTPSERSPSERSPSGTSRDGSRAVIWTHREIMESVQPGALNVLVRTTYWIPASERVDRPLRWELPEGAELLWAQVLGESVPITVLADGKIELCPIPVDVTRRIDLWTLSRNDPPVPPASPKWIGSELVHDLASEFEQASNDSKEPAGRAEDMELRIANLNLEGLATLQQIRVGEEASAPRHPGTLDRWIAEYAVESLVPILKLSRQPEKNVRAFDDVIDRYASETNAWNETQRAEIVQRAKLRIEADHDVLNIDRGTPDASVGTGTASGWLPWLDAHRDRLIATLTMALLMALAPWVWQSMGTRLQQAPWWHLIAVGVWIWILAGTWVPALVLAALGLYLAADTYWIVNERFRQIGTRGQR